MLLQGSLEQKLKPSSNKRSMHLTQNKKKQRRQESKNSAVAKDSSTERSSLLSGDKLLEKQGMVISSCSSVQAWKMENLSSTPRIVAIYKLVTYLFNLSLIQFLRNKSCDSLIYRAWAITNSMQMPSDLISLSVKKFLQMAKLRLSWCTLKLCPEQVFSE